MFLCNEQMLWYPIQYIIHFSSSIIRYSYEGFENLIPTMRSKYQPPRTTRSCPLCSQYWVGTLMEMTNAARNSQYLKVDFPPSLLKTNCVHRTVFDASLLSLFCSLDSDFRTEYFRRLRCDCGILLQKLKWEELKILKSK